MRVKLMNSGRNFRCMRDDNLVTMLTAPSVRRRERKLREEEVSGEQEKKDRSTDDDEMDKDTERRERYDLDNIVQIAKMRRQLRQQVQKSNLT